MLYLTKYLQEHPQFRPSFGPAQLFAVSEDVLNTMEGTAIDGLTTNDLNDSVTSSLLKVLLDIAYTKSTQYPETMSEEEQQELLSLLKDSYF